MVSEKPGRIARVHQFKTHTFNDQKIRLLWPSKLQAMRFPTPGNAAGSVFGCIWEYCREIWVFSTFHRHIINKHQQLPTNVNKHQQTSTNINRLLSDDCGQSVANNHQETIFTDFSWRVWAHWESSSSTFRLPCLLCRDWNQPAAIRQCVSPWKE